jgi:hypothetical protein
MIVGYQFDRAKVPALADASVYSYLSNNVSAVLSGRGNEMNVATNALSCEIDTGQAIIQGRLVEILTPEVVEIPANSSGFLVIQIDLSQVNESIGIPGTAEYSVTNNQVKAQFVDHLMNDDLNNGGVSYSFNLGSVSSTSSLVIFTRNDSIYPSTIDIPWTYSFQSGEYFVRYRKQSEIVFIHVNYATTSTATVSFGTIPIVVTPIGNLMFAVAPWTTDQSAAHFQITPGGAGATLALLVPNANVAYRFQVSYMLN